MRGRFCASLLACAGLAVFPGSVPVAAAGPVGTTVPACVNPNALGVSRTVEIDTTGGPGFGLEHYKAYDFLQPKEVVLTFDDGPQKYSTESILVALAEQCTKATFFSVGKMALGYPDIIRDVAKGGHTIGTHTWSHKPIAKLKTFEEGRDEIERGASAVKRAVGAPISPFFRFPTLVDTPEAIAYLGKRNIAMFSTDIDSFDFKPQPAERLVKGVMDKLEKKGKGIVLMHDIHKTTAKAVPLLLAALKSKGYKIVHLTAKKELQTIAEFDAAIEKDARGLPQAGAERPTASIVKTVGGDVPAAEAQSAASPSAGSAEAAAVNDVGEHAEPSQAVGKAADAATPAAAAPAASAAVGANAGSGAATTFVPTQGAAAPVAEASKELGKDVGEAAATAPVKAEVAGSPVSTVGGAGETASISKGTEATSVAADHKAPVDVQAAPAKSLSEKVWAIWEMWFGK